MSRIVKFTYRVNRYSLDLSNALRDPTHSEHFMAVKLIDLLKKYDDEQSQSEISELEKEIFELLNMSLVVELDPGELFSIKSFNIPINSSTSSLGIYLDDDIEIEGYGNDIEDENVSSIGYAISGDIYFELEANRDVSYEVMDEWDGQIELPALNTMLGDYACDSGSSISWEIEGETIWTLEIPPLR
jgi:hypothetical protein